MSDYAERVYVWNTTAFEIDDRAEFIVDANGNRSIKNFALIPFYNNNKENFDFNSNDWVARLGNPGLQNNVDPSRIGRTVEIDIVQDIDPTLNPIFDINSYSAAASNLVFANDLLLFTLPFQINYLVDELWADGTIKTTDSAGRPIVYGTEGADSLNSSDASRSSYLDELVDKGVVYIGGNGADSLQGGRHDDVYHVGGGDTINDTGGNGSVFWQNKQLTGNEKPECDGEPSMEGKYGEFYSVGDDGTLRITLPGGADSIRIEQWKNKDLGITIQEESDDCKDWVNANDCYLLAKPERERVER